MNSLNELHNVKSLTLSASQLQVVAEPHFDVEYCRTPFSNLRHLHIVTWLTRGCFQVIMFFLRNSLNVEDLVLDMMPASGKNMVGRMIKVWWPDDKEFYPGIVDSFDPIKKRHLVLYLDCDKQFLELKREKWEFIEDDSVQYRTTVNYPYEHGVDSPFDFKLHHLKRIEVRNVTGNVKGLEYLKILLNNAVVLKKMTIFTWLEPEYTSELKHFIEELVKFPRASLNATISMCTSLE